MQHDLDRLKTEIPKYLDERGFAVFRGISRIEDEMSVIYWDVEKHPDYRHFVDCAERLGIKVIVLHSREFTKAALDDVQAELDDANLPLGERRELDGRIKRLRPYVGFTGNVELSFDHAGRTYVFELRSEFMEELVNLINEVEGAMYPPPELDLDHPDDDDDDNPPKPGGTFFSRN